MFCWPTARTEGASSDRHQYTGDWVEGKMQGKGVFKHASGGHTLKGYFVNNLYCCTMKGKKYFLNPLDTQQAHQDYIKKSQSSITYDKKKQDIKNSEIRCFKVETVK